MRCWEALILNLNDTGVLPEEEEAIDGFLV